VATFSITTRRRDAFSCFILNSFYRAGLGWSWFSGTKGTRARVADISVRLTSILFGLFFFIWFSFSTGVDERGENAFPVYTLHSVWVLFRLGKGVESQRRKFIISSYFCWFQFTLVLSLSEGTVSFQWKSNSSFALFEKGWVEFAFPLLILGWNSCFPEIWTGEREWKVYLVPNLVLDERKLSRTCLLGVLPSLNK